jgi:hypothetical protein
MHITSIDFDFDCPGSIVARSRARSGRFFTVRARQPPHDTTSYVGTVATSRATPCILTTVPYRVWQVCRVAGVSRMHLGLGLD